MNIFCPNCSKDLYVTQSDPDDTEVYCGACGHIFDLFDDGESTAIVQNTYRNPHEFASKQSSTKVCHYCAETIKIEARVCKYCGYTVDQQLKNRQDYERGINQLGVSRVGFVLLGIFLGVFGIHNFYAGYAGRGITQLLLSFVGIFLCLVPNLFVVIWNIIEICAVDTDASGRRMS